MSKKRLIVIVLIVLCVVLGCFVGVNKKTEQESYTIKRVSVGGELRRLIYAETVYVFCPMTKVDKDKNFLGLVAVMLPAYTYQQKEMKKENDLLELVQKENQKVMQTSTENVFEVKVQQTQGELKEVDATEAGKTKDIGEGEPETEKTEKTDSEIIDTEIIDTENKKREAEELNTQKLETEKTGEKEMGGEETNNKDTKSKVSKSKDSKTKEEQENETETNEVMAKAKLYDFDYLLQHYYIVDSSTTIDASLLDAQKMLSEDMSITPKQGEQPQILIYHTHSQEGFADSVMEEGASAQYAYEAATEDTSIMAVGDVLADVLTNEYGYSVLHHKGRYDVGDRNHAYSNEAPELEKIVKKYPSIQVVIDLHRDKADTHLVTKIDGNKTAKIMFFNGLCRTTAQGAIDYLPNPYLKDNLAFSLQMQLTANAYYPDFARRIYLKGYRYNMHFCPKSLLIEVGAQNNTLQEAKNAMPPLAKILSKVLSSSN